MAVALLVYLGCATSPVVPKATPEETIASTQREVKGVATALEGTTTTIKRNATEGESKTPASLKPTLAPNWQAIGNAASQQEVLVAQLKAKDADFAKMRDLANGWVAYANSQKARGDKAEASLTDALRSKLNLLVILGTVGVAVSGALVFAGNRIGVATGVGSGLLVVVALTVGQSAPLVPYLVGGTVLAVVGVTIWQLIAKRNKVNLLTSATNELVRTVEASKQLMPASARYKVFGDGPIPGKAAVIQSAATQALVLKARQSLPNVATEVGDENANKAPKGLPTRDGRGRFKRAQNEQPEAVAGTPAEETITPQVD